MKVFLIVWVIGGAWGIPEREYPMPDMPTCLRKLEAMQQREGDVAQCTYRIDHE